MVLKVLLKVLLSVPMERLLQPEDGVMRLACGMLQQVSISKLFPDTPLGLRALLSTPMVQSSLVEVGTARCCYGLFHSPRPEPVETTAVTRRGCQWEWSRQHLGCSTSWLAFGTDWGQ